MTHDELADDLADHLRSQSDRIVWTNMQMGPVGSPRPDVYAIDKSYVKFRPLAYEVKISVSDFRRDVTAGKWQSYCEFAAGVIFAAPAGLLKKEDIPHQCGLITRSDTGWRMSKGPTLRSIETLPKAAWMKLMIDGLERQKGRGSREFNEFKAREKIRKRYGDKIGEALYDLSTAEYKLMMLTNSLNDRARVLDEERRLQLENIQRQVNREASLVDSGRQELAEILGLNPSASAREIRTAAFAAARQLDANEQIRILRDKLSRIREAIRKEDLIFSQSDTI